MLHIAAVPVFKPPNRMKGAECKRALGDEFNVTPVVPGERSGWDSVAQDAKPAGMKPTHLFTFDLLVPQGLRFCVDFL